ncbi:homoserine O-acetyltransferase family protein [Caldinitratiruptor microaerophilus]|uniref:Probable acyltransferase n=1 Tax=Caldinitratiruptor microaerophilus TaxID=671077 RepID=A0AA35CHI1_9FIRM|nr:alpha/beta fold hydrolase [Caldinitratiruptor microaerophilus]BDG58972.1 homoserine O-acetyltransferase [Caldinitratiruptor microaerophilus]
MEARAVFSLPRFRLESGAEIPVRIGYRTWGRLNPARDNAVLVCHHFSGDTRAAGPGGWWEGLVGPGKAIDTDRYFVICPSMLANLNREEVSTGPATGDPETGRPYGKRFPPLNVRDDVRLQRELLRHLGVDRLALVGGPSMGGYQALTWAVEFPDVPRAVVAAVTAARTPAFTALVPAEAAAAAIEADPRWQGGDYHGGPEPVDGLTRAAFLLTVTARGPAWAERNLPGGDPREAVWAIARERAAGWHASHFVAMIRKWQAFDLAAPHGSLEAALARVRAGVLLLPVRTDLFFPPSHSLDLADRLQRLGKDARCEVVETDGGHLAGVVEADRFEVAVRRFLAET